jgi:phytoene dehydrogenase-like protein
MKRSLVIGSGANGLVAAFYLARAGYRPIVLEKASTIGGGAATTAIYPGFKVPAFSHEILLHERISREMNLAAHGLQWIEQDVDACALSCETPPLVIYTDASRTADAWRAAHRVDASVWPRYLKTLAAVSGVLAPLLSEAPVAATLRPHDLIELLQTGRRLRRLGGDARHLLRWIPMSIFDFTHEWFGDEQLRACIAARAISGSMLGPRSGWSTLLMLLREAHASLAGPRPPRAVGGPGACIAAMASAARAAGAEIRTDAPVQRIVTGNGAVKGVVLSDGEMLEADRIVSTVDPRTTLSELLESGSLSDEVKERVVHYRARGTLAKVNLALDGLPPFRGIHDPRVLAGRIHIGERLDVLERAFDAAKYGEESMAPWLEMQIPSLLDTSLAPHGKHVASIYVHTVPYNPSAFDAASRNPGAHTDARRRVLERTMTILERYAPGTGAMVLQAQVSLPADLEWQLGMTGGHIFHGELVPDQLFAMRPVWDLGRYDTPVEGLYLGGAGTHPGGFLTGASGRLAAAAVLRNRINDRR